MKPVQILWLAALALAMLGASGDSARFEKLGHRLMCSCGCNQILLECNHVGCPASDGMRNEVQAGLDSGRTDAQIMDSFVAKYGAIVLAAPTLHGFDRVAWVAPFAALFFGIALTVLLVRRWHRRKAPARARTVADEALRAQIRQETQE